MEECIDTYKAKPMVKGLCEQLGFDFQDTFSSVLKWPSVRIILNIALSHKWPLRQVGVNNAFLHGEFHEEVFMFQPPNFEINYANGNVLYF